MSVPSIPSIYKGIYNLIDSVQNTVSELREGELPFYNIVCDGNVTLGNSTSDTITMNGVVVPSHTEDVDVVSLDKHTNFINYNNLHNTFYTRIGGSDKELAPQISTDDNGNVYVTGAYQSNELDIYDFTNNNVPIGSLFLEGIQCLFLTKYDETGINQWKTRITGYDVKIEPTIYNNGSGDTFVTMQSYDNGSTGDIKFYDVNNVSSPVKTLDGEVYDVANTILAKYTTDGVFSWNCRVRVLNYPDPSGYIFSTNATVTGDASGNVYLCGYYPGGAVAVYDTTSDETPAYTFTNDEDETNRLDSFFIIKYDASGVFTWFNHINGDLQNINYINTEYGKDMNISINTDTSNNLYLTSTFNPIGFNSTDLTIYKPGSHVVDKQVNYYSEIYNRGVFNIKFDSSGNYLWNNSILAVTDVSGIPSELLQTSNCIDPLSNLYLTFSNGYVLSYIVVDTNSTIASPAYTFNNNNEALYFVSLMKFNSDGIYQWNNFIDGTYADYPPNKIITNPTIICDKRRVGNKYVPSIYVQVNGYLYDYLGGFNFYNSNALNNIAYTLPNKSYYLENDTNQSMLAKYDVSGNFLWACTCANYTDENYTVTSTGIAADKDGHVYITGSFYNSLNIWDVGTNDPYSDPLGTLNNSGNADVYLIKYNRFGLLNRSANNNIYLEDVPTNGTNVPIEPSDNDSIPPPESIPAIQDGVEKSIIITNNDNGGVVDCLILELQKSGFGYQVRKTVSLVDSLDLVCHDNKWIPKLQADQPQISNDLDVIDINNKLSIIDNDDINNATWYTKINYDSTSNEQNARMSTDKDGNVIVIGTYDGSIVKAYSLYGLNWTQVDKHSSSRDVFISKYDPTGNVKWVTHIGFDSNIGNNTPYIYTDPEGNSYVTILKTDDFTSNSVYIFDTRAVNDIQKEISLNNSSTIVIKYDKNGIFQWNVRLQASYYNSYGMSDSIAVVDKDGNLYVTGYQTDDDDGIDIYDSSDQYVHNQYGYYGSFLCKFDKTGKYIWAIANKYGSIPSYKAAISCDLSGNVIITGVQQDDVDIYQLVNGTNTFYKTISLLHGNYGLYMVKYDSNGKVIWTNKLYMDTTSPIDQVTNPVTVIDGDGNFYLSSQVTGEYVYIYDTRNETDARQTVGIPSASLQNVILLKYNGNGIVQWFGFVSGISGDTSITVDNRHIKGLNNNSVYLSGSYYNNTTIGIYDSTSPSSTVATLTPLSNNDVFIVKFDKDGIFDWVSKLGGSNSNLNTSILATKDGHVYLAGEFNSTSIDVYQGYSMNNDPNSTVATTIYNTDASGITYDIFLIKYNRYGIINNGGSYYGFSRELYLENDINIPNGTEKTIVITNNVQSNNNTTPNNICLMVIEKDTYGYYLYRSLWFCEGLTMVCYNGKWLMKSSSTGDGMPKRSIIMWGGDQTDIPAGWALCNGQTFNGVVTPDLRGRFILGFNGDAGVASDSTGNRAPVNTIGNAGGELNHQLSIGETPAHTHGVTDPGHSHTVQAYDAGSIGGDLGRNVSTSGSRNPGTSSSTTGISNKYTGGKDSAVDGTTNIAPATYPASGGTVPHNNLPPYLVLAYIMKCY